MIEHTKFFAESVKEILLNRPNFTDKVIQKCALLALGFLVASMLIPKPWSFLSLGLVFILFRNVNNYSSFEDLNRMRSEARNLSFKDLIRCHGSIQNILDFQILRPEELREKLELEKNQFEKAPLRLIEAELKISIWELTYMETMQDLIRL